MYDIVKVSIIKENNIVVNCNIKELSGEQNICYHIAKLFKEKFKLKQGIKVDIIKNIPIGGGLGGASSDAACVAKAILSLFKIKTEKETVVNLCSKIGKDIPFFFYQGLCIVESLGEKVTKLKPPWTNTPLWFVIVYPDIVLLTKEVYQKYDEVVKKHGIAKEKIDKNKIIEDVKNKNFDNLLKNDLEQAAIEICPELNKVKDIMLRYSNLVSMTGSGSCFFTLSESYTQAIKLKLNIEKKLKNCKIFVARSIN